MKHLIFALFLPLLVSPSAFSEAGKYDESHISKCTMVGPEEKKLAKDEDKVTADEKAIMRLERVLCYAYQAGNMGPVMDITHENAFLFPPGYGIVSGKTAIGEAYSSFSAANTGAEGFELAWEPIDAFVSGDMGWAFGMVRVKTPGADEELGKYVSVWVKENGKWFYVAEIRNSNR